MYECLSNKYTMYCINYTSLLYFFFFLGGGGVELQIMHITGKQA